MIKLISYLQFVKACRTGDFGLYLESLDHVLPWVFATNHSHCARNLPLHVRDMCSLKALHPQIYDEFCKGNFVVQKTKRPFSMIALDQNHEQLNEILKNGGIIGNTDNPATMRLKQTVGPELSRLIQEFEDQNVEDVSLHHEQYRQFQRIFKVKFIRY